MNRTVRNEKSQVYLSSMSHEYLYYMIQHIFFIVMVSMRLQHLNTHGTIYLCLLYLSTGKLISLIDEFIRKNKKKVDKIKI